MLPSNRDLKDARQVLLQQKSKLTSRVINIVIFTLICKIILRSIVLMDSSNLPSPLYYYYNKV